MIRFLYIILFSFGIALSAQAQTFTIADIRIDGLQRISPGVVFGLLPVGIGDQVNSATAAEIIRAVTASGFFEEVEVAREGDVLLVNLLERPSVSEINITGNKVLQTEDILNNMATAEISEGGIFTRSTLEAIRQGIQEVYSSRGRYGATVELEVTELPRNRVSIDMTIFEGEESRIRDINIVGNSVFEDEELLDMFELGLKPWYWPFSSRDRYSREQLTGDIETMTSYYMNNGYIQFNVDSTPITLTPDNENIYITINVTEGEKYTVNKVDLAGDLVDIEPVLRAYTLVGSGQTFSQELITATEEFMTQVLGNFGYAFATVTGVPEINEEARTVDVTFLVEPGNRTYVNRISFAGNEATSDEVLRREMRQLEGAPASSQQIELSKVRLERLGYFSEVEVETPEVPGTTDQINVDFSVTEQNFGNVSFSVGSGGGGEFFVSADLQAQNFLGTGQTVGIGVNKSTFQKSLSFSYLDPFYTMDGVSRGFNVFVTDQDSPFNIASFSTTSFGGGFNFAYPISEVEQIGFNIGFAHTELSSGGLTVQEIESSPRRLNGVNGFIIEPANINPFDGPVQEAVLGSVDDLPVEFRGFNPDPGFIDRYGTTFNNLTFTTNWIRSTLNRGQFADRGAFHQLSLKVTVPGSDLEYYQLTYNGEAFLPITNNWVLRFKTNLGIGDGYAGTRSLPFFENFFAGGLSSAGTVRGFEENSLGPRSTNPRRLLTQPSGLIKDENGNIKVVESGAAEGFDGSQAYQTVPVLDSNGNQLLDMNGNPQVRLAVEDIDLGRRLDAFGGNILTTGSVELLFPMPFMPDRSRIRSAFFIDAGNVFSSDCTRAQSLMNNCSDFDLGEFRYSAGISVTYLSPFGPLTFYLAKPFSQDETDDEKSFDFTIGAGF
ncbi:MAG: outer membrane protein assembly factor BamA [Pseudomonadales bacterium]|nr:outer membrane protein assembly factor BamA [Pseudomonadales bacterium]